MIIITDKNAITILCDADIMVNGNFAFDTLYREPVRVWWNDTMQRSVITGMLAGTLTASDMEAVNVIRTGR